ncbi:RNA polymerase-associated protein RapA [Oxobacter pfennigii]|uniref:RNA polymerase-associated protein RapA n=1 Tax=Oxobacter pfennigii TaxID=36849 RepID=A0A0P8WAS2_9CLOT|nr:DEAD/DEAH box helicase [Oxobacter pfennigii]KPU45725.1 RNA polymerase-associated protein RapA [Oxobacter pfennigii]
MFNISENKIKNMCTSYEVYIRGLRYFLEGRIKDIDIDEILGFVEATVYGSRDYYVNIEFSHHGDLIDAACSCPAYYGQEGMCKHIAAVLLYIHNRGRTSNLSINQGAVENHGFRQSNEIISFFENKLIPVSAQPINIEVTMEIFMSGMYGKDIRPAISLRIGDKKLYVVKNIKDLVRSIDSYKPLDFGKNFTFDPSQHCFKESDLTLVEFFKEMNDIDKTVESNASYRFDHSGGLFRGKYLYIPYKILGRFLKLMEDKPLKVIAREKEYNDVKIIDRDLPVEFLLKKPDNNLVLNINISSDVIPLSPDGKHMFANGTIYNPSQDQIENLAPFYRAIAQSGTREFKFSQKDSERFASVVMPNIKKAGQLNVDATVKELFYQQPVEASVYLDKNDDAITVSIGFTYGDITIDPFNQKHMDSKLIIIRDYEKERKILDIFEQSGFKINKDAVYLDDDDLIYDFLAIHIPRLQELCQVYYSESFKAIRLYDSSYYRSSIRYNEETDLLEFNFSIDGIDKESLPSIFASLKRKKKYHRLPDGSHLPLDTDSLHNMSSLMEYLDLEGEDLKKDIINLPKFKAMYLDDSLKSFDSVYVERNLAFKRLVENIMEPKDTDFKVPENLEGIMRGYQVTGFKWLKNLSAYGMGGILADDMGLGKTLQTIAFIMSEKEKSSLPSLVICPTSLVYNWESEIQKFAPSLRALVIAGNKFEREDMFREINNADVVITSYPLIRRDIENYGDITFNYCILDEAQHIKNPSSVNAKSVKEIRAKGYFALTGTPIENNLTELWSIFDFLMPGYLSSHGKFIARFEKPIAGNDNKDSLKELSKYVRPFILRRLKKDVLKELPPKIESVLTSELTEEQKKVYLAYLAQIKGEIEEGIRIKGFEKSHIQILAGLTRLRQICCHPSLFIENYDGTSGKMEMVMELLDELMAGSHRVLLFSQFTGVLKLIEGHLKKENISFFYLDGSTKAEDRRDMVKAFNQGFRNVFLISLKAGGTGLNLTGADTVIHFDPWWNPAVEEQATDRAHRIGQLSTVQVMKLITKGTIEEKIYAMQQKKKELINSVLKPGETFISKMTEEDIRELFRV